MKRCAAATIVLALAGCGSPSREKVFIPEPGGTSTYKPRAFQFSVDGGSMWTVRRWLSYGTSSATAITMTFTNDCKPSCAGGHIRQATLTIRLQRVERCGGVRAFTELVVLKSSDPAVAQPAGRRDLRFLCHR